MPIARTFVRCAFVVLHSQARTKYLPTMDRQRLQALVAASAAQMPAARAALDIRFSCLQSDLLRNPRRAVDGMNALLSGPDGGGLPPSLPMIVGTSARPTASNSTSSVSLMIRIGSVFHNSPLLLSWRRIVYLHPPFVNVSNQPCPHLPLSIQLCLWACRRHLCVAQTAPGAGRQAFSSYHLCGAKA